MDENIRLILKGLLGGGYEPKHLREHPDHVLPVEPKNRTITVEWRFACPSHSNPALQRLRGIIGRDVQGRCVILEEHTA